MTYVPLQNTNLQTGQNLSCLVAVTDILERFRGVLAGNVEEDLLTASVVKNPLAGMGRSWSCCWTYGCSSTKDDALYTLSWITMYRSFLVLCAETSA